MTPDAGDLAGRHPDEMFHRGLLGISPGLVFRRLNETIIERVTFIATRAGTYRLPVVDAFRLALRTARGRRSGGSMAA